MEYTITVHRIYETTVEAESETDALINAPSDDDAWAVVDEWCCGVEREQESS